eukprot:4053302-Pleurochrysis_carterae.AAC.2
MAIRVIGIGQHTIRQHDLFKCNLGAEESGFNCDAHTARGCATTCIEPETLYTVSELIFSP